MRIPLILTHICLQVFPLVVAYIILPPGHQHVFIWSSWRHQMEFFSALLAICAGNSPVTGEFPAQRPVTRSFAVFLDLRLNKRLSKQWWGWQFGTPLRPFCRHCSGCTYLLVGSVGKISMCTYRTILWCKLLHMKGVCAYYDSRGCIVIIYDYITFVPLP